MKLELGYGVAILGAVLIMVGLYLNFFNDVPDDMETINLWTSIVLMVSGTIGIALGLVLKKKQIELP